MTPKEEPQELKDTDQASADFWLEQLTIYARDLGELYRAAQEAKQKLAEEKIVLEYKLRELEALNNLFMQHLEMKRRVEESFVNLIAALKRLVEEARPEVIVSELKRLIAIAEGELEGRQ